MDEKRALVSEILEGNVSGEIIDKVRGIEEALRGKRCVVGFSGGVDSSVVLAIARGACDEVIAGFIDSILTTPKERALVEKIASDLGVRLEKTKVDPLKEPEFVRNDTLRCYHCKFGDFSALKEIANKHGMDLVLDGSNKDDTGDYRPGIKAIDELGVFSPLRKFGLSKKEIREIARKIGLPNADNPSNACLASRFAYNVPISAKLVKMVASVEEMVMDTLDVKRVRARVHEGLLVRIELDAADLQEALKSKPGEVLSLARKIKELGFNYVSLDLLGYKSGSMNAVLESS